MTKSGKNGYNMLNNRRNIVFYLAVNDKIINFAAPDFVTHF